MSRIPPALALLALVIAGHAFAQQPTGSISGTVVSEQEAPLASAAVAIRRLSDSTVVSRALTSARGTFVGDGLAPGSYRVEVSSLGYATSHTPVDVTPSALRANIGTITLRPAAIEMTGVTVEGQRSPVVLAPDRSIYNVREMPVAQGGVATDALRAIPELEVDVDDNVRARGGEPQIFLDGRPLPMQGEARKAFLRTLRADRIDRVEYIPNPSARYEADGQSGIVNIVLRRDVGLGFSGSAAGNVGTRGTQNVSSRLNYQRGSLTFFGGALIGLNQSRSNSFDMRQNLAAEPVTFLQQSTGFRQNGMNGGATSRQR